MPANRKAEVDAVQPQIDFTKKQYQLTLETNLGPIKLDLWPEVAEGHCRNILGLAKIGYFDGLGFHRVIRGFMIQGGCPIGNGTGGPGYTIQAEFNAKPHEAGVLSMARTNDPNSAGSQFFICLAKNDFLDNKYTAFGKVADAESMATVEAIGKVQTDSSDKPREKVVIKKVTVREG